jgi:hypothetical protein
MLPHMIYPSIDDVHAFLGRFIAYPSAHAQAAHALWIAHLEGLNL